ncbi:hypothetical protein [Ferrovibrio terrae]|uniref:hypothetical protein n=1 Tax=Ferrovibrio terrae TaxID=2594003 RepID=UPI0031380E0C
MIHDEIKTQAFKAAPAVAGAAYSLTELTASNIAAWSTVAYIALQAFFLVRDKWWRDPQRKRFRRKVRG